MKIKLLLTTLAIAGLGSIGISHCAAHQGPPGGPSFESAPYPYEQNLVTCERCTYDNPPRSAVCEMCESPLRVEASVAAEPMAGMQPPVMHGAGGRPLLTFEQWLARIPEGSIVRASEENARIRYDIYLDCNKEKAAAAVAPRPIEARPVDARAVAMARPLSPLLNLSEWMVQHHSDEHDDTYYNSYSYGGWMGQESMGRDPNKQAMREYTAYKQQYKKDLPAGLAFEEWKALSSHDDIYRDRDTQEKLAQEMQEQYQYYQDRR